MVSVPPKVDKLISAVEDAKAQGIGVDVPREVWEYLSPLQDAGVRIVKEARMMAEGDPPLYHRSICSLVQALAQDVLEDYDGFNFWQAYSPHLRTALDKYRDRLDLHGFRLKHALLSVLEPDYSPMATTDEARERLSELRRWLTEMYNLVPEPSEAVQDWLKGKEKKDE